MPPKAELLVQFRWSSGLEQCPQYRRYCFDITRAWVRIQASEEQKSLTLCADIYSVNIYIITLDKNKKRIVWSSWWSIKKRERNMDKWQTESSRYMNHFSVIWNIQLQSNISRTLQLSLQGKHKWNQSVWYYVAILIYSNVHILIFPLLKLVREVFWPFSMYI